MKSERGYIIVTTAVLLVVLLGFLALAIDVGLGYSAHTQGQNAADGAALAGAFTFINDPFNADPKANAENYAKKVAIANRVGGIQLEDADITATADIVNRRVTVDIHRNTNTFFAKIFSVDQLQITGHSLAEASDSPTGGVCMKPFFIPNTLPADPGDTIAQACMSGKVLFDANGNQTSHVTDLTGDAMIIRPGDPSKTLVPSQYYSIEIDCPGGACFEDAISLCSITQYQCGNKYPVLTGNKAGKVKDGVLGKNGDPGLLEMPPDTWIAVAKYQHGSYVMTTSRQVMTAPVIDMCPYAVTGKFPSGSKVDVAIVGYAQVFVDGMAAGGGGQDDVAVHFISASGCNLAGGGPTETGSTVNALPLRLVRQ